MGYELLPDFDDEDLLTPDYIIPHSSIYVTMIQTFFSFITHPVTILALSLALRYIVYLWITFGRAADFECSYAPLAVMANDNIVGIGSELFFFLLTYSLRIYKSRRDNRPFDWDNSRSEAILIALATWLLLLSRYLGAFRSRTICRALSHHED